MVQIGQFLVGHKATPAIREMVKTKNRKALYIISPQMDRQDSIMGCSYEVLTFG